MSTITKYEIRVYLTDDVNRFQRYAVGEGNAKMSFDTEAEARNAYSILQKICRTNRSLLDLSVHEWRAEGLEKKVRDDLDRLYNYIFKQINHKKVYEIVSFQEVTIRDLTPRVA